MKGSELALHCQGLPGLVTLTELICWRLRGEEIYGPLCGPWHLALTLAVCPAGLREERGPSLPPSPHMALPYAPG